MAYTKTQWNPGGPPGISAENLNKIEQGIADAHDKVDTALTVVGEIAEELTAHKNDYVSQMAYAVASGTNSYTVSIPGITALVEGLSVKIKFTNANTGASTLNINGLGAKEIRKSNGNALSAGNIKAGQICHLVYTGSVFQLLGEGGEYGTALPEHVLEGYTIGTENGVVQGTMPNQGRKIITPGTTNIAIPRGYHDGTGYVQGSANLKPENIKSGVNIFNVIGTLKPITDEKKIVTGTGTFTTTVYEGEFIQYIPLTSLSITPEGFFVYLDDIKYDRTEYPYAKYIAATIKENGVWKDYSIQDGIEYTSYGFKMDAEIIVTYEENNQRLKIRGIGGFETSRVSFKWWAFGN